MARKQLIFLWMTLLGLVCVALFLYIYQTKTQPRSRPQSSPTANNQVIEPQSFSDSDPAKMRLAADQSQVEWLVDGEFVSTPVTFGDFVVADFAVKGDAAKRPLRVWFGPNNQSLLIGHKESDATGDKNVWVLQPPSVLTAQVRTGTPAQLFFLYFPERSDYGHVLRYNQFWNDINTQIQQSHSLATLNLDPGYWLYSNKVILP